MGDPRAEVEQALAAAAHTYGAQIDTLAAALHEHDWTGPVEALPKVLADSVGTFGIDPASLVDNLTGAGWRRTAEEE